jgi:serine/threonine protein kinase
MSSHSTILSETHPSSFPSPLDLKPENILLTFDYKRNEIVDLKLCDFGLGAYFEPKVQLTDFCGSPGMIRSSVYRGCDRVVNDVT